MHEELSQEEGRRATSCLAQCRGMSAYAKIAAGENVFASSEYKGTATNLARGHPTEGCSVTNEMLIRSLILTYS